MLVRFLREHRSEWADYGVDAYSAACLKASPYAVPCARPGGFPSSHVILPLAHTVEHEEVELLICHALSVMHYASYFILFMLIRRNLLKYIFYMSLIVLGGCSFRGSCIFT